MIPIYNKYFIRLYFAFGIIYDSITELANSVPSVFYTACCAGASDIGENKHKAIISPEIFTTAFKIMKTAAKVHDKMTVMIDT